jgi:hypothetical protein
MTRTTTLLLVLVLGSASVAQAQRGKGGGYGPPPTVHPGVPPASTNASPTATEAVNKHRKAADERVEAQKVKPVRATPAIKATPAVQGGKGKRATRAVRATPAVPAAQKTRELKSEEKTEKREFRDARQQSERLIKHIKLTASERTQATAIRKKYDVQYKALAKQERAADKAGTSDAAIVLQLEQLRAQERAELRGILTADQQVQFDRNGTSPKPKH